MSRQNKLIANEDCDAQEEAAKLWDADRPECLPMRVSVIPLRLMYIGVGNRVR